MAKIRFTLMPWTMAACWSSATARMATPWRDFWKNRPTAISTTAATPMAQKRLLATDTSPKTLTEPVGMKLGAGFGSAPHVPSTMPARADARPIVTMITDRLASPISRRRMSRSITIPRTMPLAMPNSTDAQAGQPQVTLAL